jgi:hypothetical protein
MQPTELLQLVGERLDRIGCAWFVTGSVASTVLVNSGSADPRTHLALSNGRHSGYLSFSEGQMVYHAAHAPPRRAPREAE